VTNWPANSLCKLAQALLCSYIDWCILAVPIRYNEPLLAVVHVPSTNNNMVEQQAKVNSRWNGQQLTGEQRETSVAE